MKSPYFGWHAVRHFQFSFYFIKFTWRREKALGDVQNRCSTFLFLSHKKRITFFFLYLLVSFLSHEFHSLIMTDVLKVAGVITDTDLSKRWTCRTQMELPYLWKCHCPLLPTMTHPYKIHGSKRERKTNALEAGVQSWRVRVGPQKYKYFSPPRNQLLCFILSHITHLCVNTRWDLPSPSAFIFSAIIRWFEAQTLEPDLPMFQSLICHLLSDLGEAI